MEDRYMKWDRSKGKTGKHKDEVPSAKEEVNPDYEEYLMLLQERNRLLRKLKEKDDQQIKLEKKEQGFSIYVNGANVELGRAQTRAKSRSSSRHSKTAGDTYHERKRILQHELQFLEREAGTCEARVKTAPGEGTTTRKGWKYDSIQIKTEEGQKLRIRAPGKLTGKYSEDFESFAVDDSDNEDQNQNLDVVGDDPDNSSEHGELNIDNDEDDEETDELALSFNDVESLRKSLEADETIRESIEAAHKKLEQERKEGKLTEDDDDVSDNEIAEELEEANDSLNLHDAAVLGQLPQLSSTADKRQHDFNNPGVHSHDRTSSIEGSRVNTGTSENNPPNLTVYSQDTTASREDLIHEKQHISNKDKGAPKPTLDRVSVRQHTGDKTDYHQSRREEVLPSSKDQQPLEENPEEDLVVLSFSSSHVKRKRRVLSATRRKENADNFESSQPTSSRTKKDANIQEPKRLRSDELQEQEMALTFAHKKRSRPLSATRKSKTEDKLDSNAEEIFKAMAKENQTIESRTAGCQTAPERSKNNSSPLPEINRPSSISSLPMKTEETIALVTEKVRHMDARQQWYLIDLLAKLECKVPFKSSGPIQSPRQSPLKATVPFVPVTNSASAAGSSQQCGIIDSLNADEDDETRPNEEGTDVYFEILSNWGNPKLLGLTEIRFFDLEGNLIPYHGQDVRVSGHVGLDGPLENLANGKTKTTKGRYMWCCEYQTRCPVELVFHLPYTTTTEHDSHGLSKICVWNFNRGIKELNVGVKDVRIFVGGELVWEGIIDKGCGNQVFDYCKVINLLQKDTEDLTEVPEPLIRSETIVLRRSRDLDKEGDLRRRRSEVQENEVPPSTRSKTVLLKKSTEGDVPEIGGMDSKDGAGMPLDSQSSMTVESTHPKDNVQKLPRPPGSSRSHSRSPRTARRSKTELEKSIEQKDKEVRRTSTPKRDSFPLAEKTLQSLLDTSKSQLESALITRASSTPNLPSSTAAPEKQDSGNDSIRGNFGAVPALPSKPPWLETGKKKDKDGSSSRSSSRSKSRPIWLENDSGISEGRSSSLTDVRDSTDLSRNEKPQSRPPSGRKSSTPSGTPAEPWPSAFISKDESLPTFLDNTAFQVEHRGRSDSGRGREETQEPTPPNNEDEESRQHHDAQSARAKWRRQQNLSLEESWSLLTLFEKLHRGRITKDLDLENHDDALDQLLSNRKEGNQEVTKEAAKETGERLIDLEIPTLPKGKQLIINVRSTWGDRHYVGLNGIEVFTDTGKPADIAEITANPPDINVLPEYGNDPRVVTNLIDGVYRTRDDMHLWLAPFTPGGLHSITITFLESVRVAMIRIWNYNKSRIHSFRGVRCTDMSLDGCLIFQGEIERASGTLGAGDPFGDTILFTMDEDILESMAQYDQTYVDDEEDSLMQSCNFQRPSTADQGEDGGSEDRPFTSARQHIKKTKPAVTEDKSTTSCDNCLVGNVLQLNFVSTWGDPYYLGLTGLEVLGIDLQPVPLSLNMLTACPRDLNDLPEYEDDDRTLDKVIDGTNVTLSDEHMWLIPFTEGEDHVLIIDLGQSTPIAGLRIWNYNKSTDDSFRGAKQFHVKLDDRTISPPEGFLLRKGPGNIHFDYGQDVFFVKPVKEQPTDCKKDAANPRLERHMNLKKLMPDYEPTLMPCGFVFQFQLFSTWGDPYYIGLNGLEFYDENGYKIKLTKNNITAHPHSVNVLEGVVEDIRTPDKLIDGFNDTNDGRHMWLAPVIPGMINFIYVVFDEPLMVSMVKVWNYSKTPIRGVQQFGLLVDDLLVYSGILPKVPAVTRGILPNLDMPTPHHTILFTDQEQIAMSERKNVLSNRGGEQDIQLTNDKRIVSHFNDPKSAGRAADPALRPMTSVPATQRKR